MLPMLLSALLLAAATPATAHLELQPVGKERLELQLCFQGSGHVRFTLEVESSGPVGRSSTRQSGTQNARAEMSCPLRNSLGLSGDTQVHARLHWWLDGVEQPLVERHYPELHAL